MASEQTLMGIGEVSALTGVNSVTLRAWQRRYGLLTPQRTPKGHRLFSNNDVERIREILGWLDKGVAISQVKPLIGSKEQLSHGDGELGEVEQLTKAIETVDLSGIHNILSTAFREYPFSVLKSRLISPLESHIFKAQPAVRDLYENVWQSAITCLLTTFTSKRKQEKNKKPCLLVTLDSGAEYKVALKAYELVINGFDVNQLMSPITSPRLIAGSLAKTKETTLVIHSDNALPTNVLTETTKVQLLPNIQLLFVGDCIDIHPEQLKDLRLQ
ncbi:hypothetical protein CS022_03245 [Veronia nyctiphanis]|uniref:HTH merR-type domain-containing protein n=1 Tax=Veronia nyctiphanis TaxID=1278244 RepID=A0A4Q0YTM6_9GAMM|nr:MerR family transcriptional regulator [Veronia nyctiphanis]RXJ74597.1 hypothetical protein CS022_03245 [Veronia nyctiphanis]